MSEGFVVAYMTFVGTILGAVIAAFTNTVIERSKKKSNDERINTKPDSISGCLLVFLGSFGGLVLGSLVGIMSIYFSSKNSDNQATPTLTAQFSFQDATITPFGVAPQHEDDETELLETSTPMQNIPQRFLSEPQMPSSTKYDIYVDPDTIHVFTSGPICVDETCLPGGETRGSVVILLPRSGQYNLTRLVPYQNWHAAYYADAGYWELLSEEIIEMMKRPGNCTGGSGCTVVDLLVMGQEGIIERRTE